MGVSRGRWRSRGEISPVVVLILGQAEVCCKAGEKGGEWGEMVQEADVEFTFFIEEVEGPEE